MLTLPIARREMLVTAKSAAMYRSRVGNSIGLLVLGTIFALVYHYKGLRGVVSIIQSITGIFLVVCLFTGVHLTSDAIAQEKREGTLGLLFLTPLTAFQIILGKMIACSLAGFYWLLVAVPLLSLMLIVGGMSGREMAMLVVAGVNTLFLSAAVGMFASTRHSERKKAAGLGTWIVMFFWMGAPALAALLVWLEFPHWTVGAMKLMEVQGAMVFYTGLGPRTQFFPWLNVGALHLVGWLFLVAATVSLKRNWQEVSSRKRRTFREWWKDLSLGKPATRLRLRQRFLDRNAFFWLASRERLRALGIWIATVILVLVAGISVIGIPGGMLLVVLTFAISLLQRAAAAGLSAQQLQSDYEQGTLEMIFSTPLRVEEMIRGQVQATIRFMRGPVAIVLLLHVVAIALALTYTPAGNGSRIAGMLALHAVMFLFDLYVLAWAGMWTLTLVRDGRNAAGAALVRVTLTPVLIVIAGMSLGGAAGWYFGFGFEPTFAQIVMSWLALAVANNIFWLRSTRRRLPDELRKFAMKRYSPEERLSLLGSFGRWLGARWSRAREASKGAPIGPAERGL